MKKIISALALFFICHCAKSQITLEQTYSNKNPNASGQVILFTSNGEKILMTDTGANQVKLYNTDYTLWKTINVSNYSGYRLSMVNAVSDNLFNTDNMVEFVATYYNSSLSAPTCYKAEVINESGVVVQDLGNTYSVSVHVVDGHHKLFAVQVSSGAAFSYNIYSLPGTLPCGHCGSLGVESPEHNNDGSSISAPVPNPNSGQTTINYTLPGGVSQGVITLFNANGQLVKTYNVGSSSQSISLDNSNLPSGVYYYNLTGNGIEPTGNKMIIVR